MFNQFTCTEVVVEVYDYTSVVLIPGSRTITTPITMAAPGLTPAIDDELFTVRGQTVARLLRELHNEDVGYLRWVPLRIVYCSCIQ